MAVTFVIGNAHSILPRSGAGTTISAPSPMNSPRRGRLYTSSLDCPGLILFFITFIVLAAARLMLMRMTRKAGR
jgi:phosphate transport system permease protein